MTDRVINANVGDPMRLISGIIGMVVALFATEVSAQAVNLTGAYKCMQLCRDGLVGSPAYVTQNGPAINLLNEAGEASRAWPDWFAPASRIWIENWDQGAVYSPDGMIIQFDRGTIWQRDLGLPPPPPYRRRHR
jgi:hypothetical protein